MKPIANLIHVEDVERALNWYKQAFPESSFRTVEGFTFLDVHGVALELVPADAKVSSGKSGSVTYWEVDDLESEILRFKNLGSFGISWANGHRCWSGYVPSDRPFR